MGQRKENLIKLNCSNQEGASLVFVLIVTFLLISLATIIIKYSNTDIRSSFKHENQTNAYYIAEAGLEEGVYEVNKEIKSNNVPPTTLSNTSFQGGQYDVSITPKINDFGENIGYDIISSGMYKGEKRTLTSWVRQPIWPENGGDPPKALEYAIYGKENVKIQTVSGLLGLGFLSTHEIKVNGNVHSNGIVELKHYGLFTTDPKVNSFASSTRKENIRVDGLESSKKVEEEEVPMPLFDFDYARKKAQEEGKYIPHDLLSISLLGLTTTDKVIFVDGDMVITGLDLLGLSLMNRTIVVNGEVTGLLEVGGLEFIPTNLNIIAKDDINFLGLVTGLQINGILFSQGEISTKGHVEVNGYVGAKDVKFGTGLVTGLLDSILSLVNGDMKFVYNRCSFENLPSGIGFKQNEVEVIEQKESAANEEE